MRFFLSLIALAVVLIGVFGGFFNYLKNKRAGTDNQEKFILVLPKDNFAKVGHKLAVEGLIADERLFRWYTRIAGVSGKLKVGEYALRADMTQEEIVQKIISGKSVLHKFTIPEGVNKFQIAVALGEHGLAKADIFLDLCSKASFLQSLHLPTLRLGDALPPSLEGYLYPDTYMISRVMNEEEILRMMVKRFREVYEAMADKFMHIPNAGARTLTPHEVIILSSIVEKETGSGKERPMIASVFYNRLRKGMRLQSDPTTIYGMWDRDGKFEGNIRREDLQRETPYNTYTLSRLPKGPIANPGKNAWLAVLSPEDTKFLYFVSRNDGTHVFSRNFQEHQRAVNTLQKDPKMRQGKSWRNLPASERAAN